MLSCNGKVINMAKRVLAALMIAQLAATGCGRSVLDQVDLPENTVVFIAVARHAASQNEKASARMTINFFNNSDKARTFLFGMGIPPAVCKMGAENASIVIQAQFTCPLEYEHDCFHAQTITLEPGQEHDCELDISVPEEFFSHAEGHQVRATYVTRNDRTAGEPITLIGKIAFYRRWHGISAEEGYSVHHSLPTPGNHPAGIAFDGEHLWAVDSLEKKIYKLDPRSGKVCDEFTTPGSLPAGLCWDGRDFFLSDTLSHRIYQCSSKDFASVSSFAAPGKTPIGLACNSGFLWHVDHDIPKIFKIDPKTGEVVGSIHLPDGRHMGIAFVGDHIWLADGLRRLLRKVDPTTGEIVKEVKVVTPYPVSLTSWGDDLYFADSGSGKIYRIRIKE